MLRSLNHDRHSFESDMEQAAYIAYLTRCLGEAWCCDGSDPVNGRALVQAAKKIEDELIALGGEPYSTEVIKRLVR